ncbi:hypothetical protein B566_EDAN002447 [Ephemera danica]|nr:hypothetical protein B566_EDAN002447 [Ephemera danica]
MTGKKEEGRIRSYLREFSEGTTLHVISKFSIDRLCWIGAMLSCAAVCGFQIVNVWTRWHVSPVINSFAQRATRVSEIPFPAITICPVMQIPRDVFDMDTVLQLENNDELTFSILRQNLTHAMPSHGNLSEEDAMVVLSSDTVGPEAAFGITLRIPDAQKQESCFHPYLRNKNMFQVFVHSPADFPLYGAILQPLTISPWSETEIRLKPSITTTEPSLRAYSPETRDRTWQRCFSAIPIEKCEEILKNLEEQKSMCDYCLPSCDEIRYDRNIMSRSLDPGSVPVVKDKKTGAFKPANLTGYTYARLTIYFEEKEFLGIQRSEGTSTNKVINNCVNVLFAANCGGLLGLFTGFSVITMFEVLYFATLRLCCTLRHQRHKIAPEDLEGEEKPVVVTMNPFKETY